jgi:hypothetical protein
MDSMDGVGLAMWDPKEALGGGENKSNTQIKDV